MALPTTGGAHPKVVDMKLIEDWRALFLKLYSVRLALIAGVLSGAEAGFQLVMDGRITLGFLVALISFGAAVSRIVAQPKAIEDAAVETIQREQAKP